jgi:hypothetical protein
MGGCRRFDMRVNDLVRFIKERDRIRVLKEAGKPRPWTKDPILGKFRFCNVHREDDQVTRWLRASWYKHLSGDPDIWFAAVVARLFNYPDSLYDIMPYVLPWKPERVRKILHDRKDAGEKNFNAAYIVSTNGVAMEKVDYLVARVLGPLWADRKKLRGIPLTLEEYHERLTQYDGLGSFIAAQVIADLKYEPEWRHVMDWSSFASSGPGSRRGLNRVAGRSSDSPWKESHWRACLRDLQEAVNKKLPEPFHAQDLQNCLCEFDKYERARLGQGVPKQIYTPNQNDPLPF